jgi:hypothetical protein
MANDTKQGQSLDGGVVPDWKVQQRRKTILLKMGTTA